MARGFALATGILTAAYSFLGGLGVRSSPSVLGFQAWLEILTGVGMLAFVAIRRPGGIRAFARTSGGIGLFAGALSVGGYLAFLAAAKVLPLAPVAALRECSLIFGTVIGAVLLKEPFWGAPHCRGRSGDLWSNRTRHECASLSSAATIRQWRALAVNTKSRVL